MDNWIIRMSNQSKSQSLKSCVCNDHVKSKSTTPLFSEISSLCNSHLLDTMHDDEEEIPSAAKKLLKKFIRKFPKQYGWYHIIVIKFVNIIMINR